MQRTEPADLDRLAIVVIDVQKGFDDATRWGPRNNPECEGNIAALIREWRSRSRPVVFVRHDSTDPESPLAPGQPGNDFKEVIEGKPDLLVTKTVNSAFHGTPDLDGWLKSRTDLHGIVICGITTNHCCETTARVGGNLGHRVLFAMDATHTFDRATRDGLTIPADTLAAVTGANLHGEFADVVSTADLLPLDEGRESGISDERTSSLPSTLLGRPTMTIRPASARDRQLLREATLANVNFAEDRLRYEDLDADPRLAHYFESFPGDGDFGFILEEEGEPVAAVWLIIFPADAPGYGFVTEGVPELSVSVRAENRGEGLGGQLLALAIGQARERRFSAISLSVEHGNPARRLYERHGFLPIGQEGNSETMLLELT